ncbi:Gfo/Idh/MocA family oxidoreductase [Paenibacillus sp. N3/727]|uniref:Gfo/Idh/MocA family protein n=1 Tax=Paenibacillus sp. N3/727 TaxID=2925845 RepID=UPI001F52F367|nr:Gfo/Idh/MocA family oxidoreductase [Paenibacillus sp. N3/727]UNK18936.1 Gfo/Idh/MocA family oxidoreductase [Paenibacillus sp. N3/727]
MRLLNIGIIGLDTSHAVAFTRLLNDPGHPYHIPGGRVTAAFPGGSPDFPLSASRVDGFTKEIKEQFGVAIMNTPEEVAAACDVILLLSADGRVHLRQFRSVASYGKPVFIDKPLALSLDEAKEIFALASDAGVPLMSSSSLRYADALVPELAGEGRSSILGADVLGQMDVQPTQSHYFWYGIHAVELLYTVMGRGAREVFAVSTETEELITGVWQDGRIGTVRGSRRGSGKFTALIHRSGESRYIDAGASDKPWYASLLEQVIMMFTERRAVLPAEETLEIISFLEAAEKSRQSGCKVQLVLP